MLNTNIVTRKVCLMYEWKKHRCNTCKHECLSLLVRLCWVWKKCVFWSEINNLRFYHITVWQFMELALFKATFSLLSFLVLFYLHPQGRMGCLAIEIIRKDKQIETKKREWHELPNTEIEKSGNIRLLVSITLLTFPTHLPDVVMFLQ